jgi:hypothetical protein
MFVCETCKESVDVSDPDVVYTVEIREALRFIGSEEVEGARRLLPRGVFPLGRSGLSGEASLGGRARGFLTASSRSVVLGPRRFYRNPMVQR